MRASPPTTWLARPSTMAGRVAPAMGLGHSQWWAGAFASPPNPTQTRPPAHTGPWAQPHNTQATDMPQSPSNFKIRASTFRPESSTTLTSVPRFSRDSSDRQLTFLIARCADAPRARLTQSGTSCHAAEHRCRARSRRGRCERAVAIRTQTFARPIHRESAEALHCRAHRAAGHQARRNRHLHLQLPPACRGRRGPPER